MSTPNNFCTLSPAERARRCKERRALIVPLLKANYVRTHRELQTLLAASGHTVSLAAVGFDLLGLNYYRVDGRIRVRGAFP